MPDISVTTAAIAGLYPFGAMNTLLAAAGFGQYQIAQRTSPAAGVDPTGEPSGSHRLVWPLPSSESSPTATDTGDAGLDHATRANSQLPVLPVLAIGIWQEDAGGGGVGWFSVALNLPVQVLTTATKLGSPPVPVA